MRTVRKFDDKMKAKAIARVAGGEPIKAVAGDLKIPPSMIYRWKKEAKGDGPTARADKANGRMEQWIKGERAQLVQLIGEKELEIMRLKGRK